MDSTIYNNIIEYKTSLELDFLFAKNNERILCSCGKMILKGGKWSHWNGIQHKMITENILLNEQQKKKLIYVPN